MTREEFLRQPDIEAFISWLSTDVSNRVFTLNIKPSRYVPNGLKLTAIGIEALVTNYRWNARWKDTRTNTFIDSVDWETTKASLKRLRQWLKESVNTSNESETLRAADAVLQWGGVSGARGFLTELANKNELTDYLKLVRNLLMTDRMPSQKISDINAINIRQFDSGLTKIHAFLDESGSPIYDTRVAGAISLLYCIFRENLPKSIKSSIAFPCGAARGDQLRNPGKLGFTRAKDLYAQTPSHEWARIQLQLGWLIIEVLRRNHNLFESEESLPDRAHAFEAGLFMAGYDLRCFSLSTQRRTTTKSTSATGTYGAVPTGHPFKLVLKQYVRAAKDINKGGGGSLRDLMFYEENLRPNTKNAYLFPLRKSEFNLLDGTHDIERLEQKPFEWLQIFFGGQGFSTPDERRHVCLIDAWITGYLNDHFLKSKHINLLLNSKLARTKNSASLILSVGQSVGHYFSLLDENGAPTREYRKFFVDMSELEDQIQSCNRA